MAPHCTSFHNTAPVLIGRMSCLFMAPDIAWADVCMAKSTNILWDIYCLSAVFCLRLLPPRPDREQMEMSPFTLNSRCYRWCWMQIKAMLLNAAVSAIPGRFEMECCCWKIVYRAHFGSITKKRKAISWKPGQIGWQSIYNYLGSGDKYQSSLICRSRAGTLDRVGYHTR